MGIAAMRGVGSTPSERTPVVTREWAWVGVVALGLQVLTALPYLFGYLVAGPERQFMGIVLNVPDTTQYFSWARESAHSLLIQNKLTPEAGDPVYLNFFWWIVGQLAALTRLGPAEATQLVRPVAGALYVIAIYWFVGLVARSRLERWTTFLVAAFGGGLGWTLVFAKQVSGNLAAPLDVYVTEANTFLTVMAFPLQAMAGALQIAVLGLAALAFERRSAAHAALAGFLALILGVQHGYDLLIVYAVVGVLGLVLVLRDGGWLRTIGLGALVCGPSMPAALYLAYLTRESPIWRGVLAQYGNAGVYTPTPPHLLVLMGIPLLIILASVPLLVTRRAQTQTWFQQAAPRDLLVWIWLIVGGLLLYIPTDFQIKMLAGWQVPIAVVATRVVLDVVAPMLARVRPLAKLRLRPLAAVALVVLVLPVNLYLFSWRFVDIARRDYPYFLRRDEMSALHWLETNSRPSDVVLSSLTIGQYVPSISGNTAFLAHWAQTLDYYTKQRLVGRFFDSNATEQERSETLRDFAVGYVFRGPQERALGDYDPEQSPIMEHVYSTSGVDIYRVTTDSLERASGADGGR